MFVLINMFLFGKILGVWVEGILRQSADVDEVEQRVRDYERGSLLSSSFSFAHHIFISVVSQLIC